MYYNKPKTKRGEQTMQKICAAAESLFAQKGYYGTEVTDITRDAGISAGTFYIYFPDKLSLFRYLMEELGRGLRKEIRLAKQEQAPCSMFEQEALGIRTFFRYITKHIGLFTIVWQALYVDPKAFQEYYEQFSRGYIRQISAAQAAGELGDFAPEHLSYYLMGVYNFVALKSFMFDGKEPSEEEIDTLIRFIRYGMEKPETCPPQ
jgi:AcrR family transcriptional regulator